MAADTIGTREASDYSILENPLYKMSMIRYKMKKLGDNLEEDPVIENFSKITIGEINGSLDKISKEIIRSTATDDKISDFKRNLGEWIDSLSDMIPEKIEDIKTLKKEAMRVIDKQYEATKRKCSQGSIFTKKGFSTRLDAVKQVEAKAKEAARTAASASTRVAQTHKPQQRGRGLGRA